MSSAARRRVSIFAAAHGVIDVVNANMERALRYVSVERGNDPRGFTLVPFGGAGGLHAVALARALRIPRILVPASPGALSANGILIADVVKEQSRTVMLEATRAAEQKLIGIFREMEKQARADLRREGFAENKQRHERSLAVRYQGQSFELQIKQTSGNIAGACHRAHLARYGYAQENNPVEIVSARVRSIGVVEKLKAARSRAVASQSFAKPHEMVVALRRTSFSQNIKERRDYSCAVFDSSGRVIAQGDHMPVHLGSMPMAVAAALSEVEVGPGDVVALNDPFAGGTHLPDVTLVTGVFAEKTEGGKRKAESRRQKAAYKTGVSAYRLLPSASCLFYVANRAHHADIGGATPGSMGLATDVYGEGVRIPPIHLVRGGEICADVMKLILANVRSSHERRADFKAQIGSLKTGSARLLEIVARRGTREASEYAEHLISYSSRMMRRAIAAIPDGSYQSEDALDDDGISAGEIPIRVRLTIKDDRARVDFTGSSPQVAGALNAVESITVSAVSYVFRCLVK